MIAGILGVIIAIFCFGILIDVPKKYLITATLVGISNGCVYLICLKMGANTVLASFFSALTAAFISHIFARFFKAPVTLFLITGILPTVPGGGMYRIVANILDDSPEVFNSFIETLEIAGVIALAIFIVDAVFRVKKADKNKPDKTPR